MNRRIIRTAITKLRKGYGNKKFWYLMEQHHYRWFKRHYSGERCDP